MTGFGPYEAVEVATTSDELRAYIREAIEETAGHGKAVIVAHAASHALAGRQDALRVLVTASRQPVRAGSPRPRSWTRPKRQERSRMRTPAAPTT